MPLYEDRRVCFGCGRMGVTQQTCPDCPCKYCGKSGHTIRECRKLLPCKHCGTKGHKPENCHEKPSEPSLSVEVPIAEVPIETDDQFAVGNVKFQPRLHDDESWFAVPEAIRHAVPQSMPFVLPNLDDICISVVRDVMAGRLPGSEAYDYEGSILANGGPQTVALEAKRCILPEIKDLQGKTVTRSILDEIWKQQVSQGMWNTAASDMGYVDYITDDRDNEYFRMYHGQAKSAYQRIVKDHGEAILGGCNESLHYYLLWLGNGHRTANFLKIWNLPEGYRQRRGDEWTDVMMILYESINIRAFRLHHGLLHSSNTIDRLLGLGLNVMTPLVQGRRMPQNLKEKSKEPLLTSADAQIAYWPRFRAVQIASKRARQNIQRLASRPLFRGDFSNALQEAVRNPQILEPLRQSLTAELKGRGPGNLASDIPFTGHLSAKIGFLLDFARTSRVSESSHVESTESSLPWAIRGCDFTEDNVLLWTFNFQKLSCLDTKGSIATDETQDPGMLAKHLALINASQTRIILVCGSRAEDIVRQALRPSRQKDLELRGFKYPLYLMDTQGPVPKRLFIRCPEIPSDKWSMTATHAARLCEVLRFATRMTGTEGVRPYFVESSGVLGCILSIARKERNDPTVQMTIDTLDPMLKIWLVRKGFESEEDLRKLEVLAGRLSTGLLILLHALPRGSGAAKKIAASSLSDKEGSLKRKRSDQQRFGDIYEPTFAFVSDILNKREAKYHEMEEALTNPAEIAEELFSEPKLESLFTRDTLRHCADSVDYATFKLAQEIAFATCEQSDTPPAKKSTSTIRGKSWWHNFRNEEYEGDLRPGDVFLGASPLACDLRFPRRVANGSDTCFFKIELLPPGSSHDDDRRYAKHAKLEDPARRLAFRCRLPKYGFYYPRVETTEAVFKANTAVNILEGMTREDINGMPRRFAMETIDGKQRKWYTSGVS